MLHIRIQNTIQEITQTNPMVKCVFCIVYNIYYMYTSEKKNKENIWIKIYTITLDTSCLRNEFYKWKNTSDVGSNTQYRLQNTQTRANTWSKENNIETKIMMKQKSREHFNVKVTFMLLHGIIINVYLSCVFIFSFIHSFLFSFFRFGSKNNNYTKHIGIYFICL